MVLPGHLITHTLFLKLHSWSLRVPHSHKIISSPENKDINKKPKVHREQPYVSQEPDDQMSPQAFYKCYSQGSGGGGRGGGGSSVAAAAAAFACAASFVIDLVILPLRRPWLLAVFRPRGAACSLSSVSSGAASVLSFSLVFSLEVLKYNSLTFRQPLWADIPAYQRKKTPNQTTNHKQNSTNPKDTFTEREFTYCPQFRAARE